MKLRLKPPEFDAFRYEDSKVPTGQESYGNHHDLYGWLVRLGLVVTVTRVSDEYVQIQTNMGATISVRSGWFVLYDPNTGSVETWSPETIRARYEVAPR